MGNLAEMLSVVYGMSQIVHVPQTHTYTVYSKTRETENLALASNVFQSYIFCYSGLSSFHLCSH